MIGKSFLIFFVGLNLMAFNLLGSEGEIGKIDIDFFRGVSVDFRKIAYTNAEKNVKFFFLTVPPFEKKVSNYETCVRGIGEDMNYVLNWIVKYHSEGNPDLLKNLSPSLSQVVQVKYFFDTFEDGKSGKKLIGYKNENEKTENFLKQGLIQKTLSQRKEVIEDLIGRLSWVKQASGCLIGLMDYVFSSFNYNRDFYNKMILDFINPKNGTEFRQEQIKRRKKFIEKNRKSGLKSGEKESFKKRLSLFEKEIKKDYIKGLENEIAKLEKLLKDGSL